MDCKPSQRLKGHAILLTNVYVILYKTVKQEAKSPTEKVMFAESWFKQVKTWTSQKRHTAPRKESTQELLPPDHFVPVRRASSFQPA